MTTHSTITGAGQDTCTRCGTYAFTYWRICGCGQATAKRCGACGGEAEVERVAEAHRLSLTFEGAPNLGKVLRQIAGEIRGQVDGEVVTKLEHVADSADYAPPEFNVHHERAIKLLAETFGEPPTTPLGKRVGLLFVAHLDHIARCNRRAQEESHG